MQTLSMHKLLFFKNQKLSHSVWLVILWSLYSYPGHAAPKTNGMQDTELIIQKQQHHKLDPEQRLYFKAPIVQSQDAPLLDNLKESIPFDHAPITYPPLKGKQLHPHLHYDGLLGITNFWRPYLQANLYNVPLLKGHWYSHLSYIPTVSHQHGHIKLQGKYHINAWDLTCNADYNHHHYVCSSLNPRKLHHYNTYITLQNITPHTSYKGQITYKPLYTNTENEQLVEVDYQWIMQRSPANTYQIDSHYALAHYGSQTRQLLTLIPQYKHSFSQAYVLHIQWLIHYHNHNIPLLSRLQFYPSLQLSEAKMQQYYIGLGGLGLSHTIKPIYFQTLLSKQPYLKNPTLQHSYQGLICYGGYQDTIGQTLYYHINLAFRQRQYLGRILPHNDNYTYAYSDQNHYSLKCKAYANYKPAPAIYLTCQLTIYKHLPNPNLPVWWYNKPAIKWQPSISYSPNSKLTLTGYGHIRSQTTIKDQAGNPTQLSPYINLALQAHYKYKNHISWFFKLDNLLNRKNKTYTSHFCPPVNFTIGIQYI